MRGNGGCYLRAQVLRKTLKIISLLALVSREVPRFQGRSLWHSTPANAYSLVFVKMFTYLSTYRKKTFG